MPNPTLGEWPDLPVGKVALTDKNGDAFGSENGSGFPVTFFDLLAGEDLSANRLMTEVRCNVDVATADNLIDTGSGVLHSITVSPLTATPTAGLLTIYDNTAESGTVLHSEWVFASSPSRTILIDGIYSTGIYVGYDGTLANVGVEVSYRPNS